MPSYNLISFAGIRNITLVDVFFFVDRTVDSKSEDK
jgi:hypothetical protein